MARGNTHKNPVKVEGAFPEIFLAGPSDRQTDTAVAMLRCPIGGGLSDKIIHEVWRVDRAKQMSRVRHRHCISDVIASLSGDSARRCDFRV